MFGTPTLNMSFQTGIAIQLNEKAKTKNKHLQTPFCTILKPFTIADHPHFAN